MGVWIVSLVLVIQTSAAFEIEDYNACWTCIYAAKLNHYLVHALQNKIYINQNSNKEIKTSHTLREDGVTWLMSKNTQETFE